MKRHSFFDKHYKNYDEIPVFRTKWAGARVVNRAKRVNFEVNSEQ
jgi:hypothetical protein